MALWGGTRGSAMSGGPHRPRLGKAGRFWRTERIGDLLIEAGLLFSLLSKIYGLILAREVVQACDRVPFPWHRRYGIRRIV